MRARRLCAGLLALVLTLTVLPVRAGRDTLSAAVDRAAAYLCGTVTAPAIGSVGGEWAVLGLARSGRETPEGYYRRYFRAAEQTVREKNGVLHQRKYSEYSRVILALRAIGADPTQIAGYDLTAPLADVEATLAQGVNGAVWALIALDCGPYGTEKLRQKYVSELLSRQLGDGGWSMTGDRADTDVTAMALQALAPHRTQKAVDRAIRSGVDRLAELRGADGDYGSAESDAQVLVAVCRLGLADARFDRLTDALLTYARPDGGFAHTANQKNSDPMASEQALYALTAAERARDGRSGLYAMDDVKLRHPEVSPPPVRLPGRTFADLAASPYRKAAETLAARGILAGRGDGLFHPEEGLTRAEFASLTVRALGLPAGSADGRFSDVAKSAWYAPAVAAACNYGIAGGVGGGRFDPEGPVTREQAAVMLVHAAGLCAVDTRGAGASKLAVSPWAREAVAFCRENEIWIWNDLKGETPVLRGEMAEMLYRTMERAAL